MTLRKLVPLVLFAAAVAALPARASPAGRPPNIVFILIDDLGWRDLSCTGSRYYETRQIDQLASEGMRFTQAEANAPNCAPSRASLLTGMYTPRHGIYTVDRSDQGKPGLRGLVPTPNTMDLNPRFQTIANALKPTGFISASIGKWHIGDDASGPLAHGFDLNLGGSRRPHQSTYFSPYHIKYLPDGPKGEYLTDRLTDEAIKFIRSNADRPFFLYLPHYAVHQPLGGKPELIAHFAGKAPDGAQDNPVYAAMIASVDQSVGRILTTLDELHLAAQTMVVFMSDNGGLEGATDVRPLRGGKGWPYEGGLRVPLIIRWPGHVPAATESAVPVIGTDLFPTFLEITGSKPLPQPMDGRSLLPLLTGHPDAFPANRAIFWHLPFYVTAYSGKETGLPSYIYNRRAYTWRCVPCSIIRQGAWKLIESFEDGHLELYNLDRDPGEHRNLAQDEPARAQALLRTLKAWQTEVHAPIPSMPNPAHDPSAPAAIPADQWDDP